MKKLSTFLVILMLLSLQNSFANNSPTVLEQLENLNKYWKGQDPGFSVLKERISLTDDISLIQMHLSLVEETLRNKNVEALSAEQKLNRLKCLDILHTYWTNGVFPKNLYHTNRTPYFIDAFGTACAVGQLIISTGHEVFAKKVSAENNYAYITELNSTYPEISEWATAFGFTIDELSWIQPCYCFTSTPGTINVSCNGGWDGYFVPAVTGWPPPYVYNAWFWWNSTTASWDMLSCGGCNLIPGDYKCTVTDGVGTPHDYFATITEPSAISETINYTNDNGFCNATANVTANGGTPGYTYLWAPGSYTNDSLTDLCQGTYTVTVTDNNGCTSTETVTIVLATSIQEISKSIITIFPNPASGKLNFMLSDFFHHDHTFASVYNVFGQQIINEKVKSADTSIDISQIDNGVYLIRIDNGNQIETHQFIKKE